MVRTVTRRSWCRTLAACLALALVAGGQLPVRAAAPAESSVGIVGEGDHYMLIEFVGAGLQLVPVQAGDESYVRVTMPGTAQHSVPGEPELPTRGDLIGLPSSNGVAVEVLDGDYSTLLGYRLPLAPVLDVTEAGRADSTAAGPATVPAVPSAERTALYPGELARLGGTGFARDQAVAQVQFYPVQYQADRLEMRVYSRILVRLSWQDPAGTGRPAAQEAIGEGTAAEGAAAQEYEGLLRGALLNYDSLDRTARQPRVSGEVVSPGASAMPVVPDALTTGLKISVTEDGLYRLTAADLVRDGLNLTTFDPRTLKMFNRGVEMAIYVQGESDGRFDAGDTVLFYGQAYRDLYTYTNVYWLAAGGAYGRRMQTRDGAPTAGTTPASFRATYHAEQATWHWSGMLHSPGLDRWFWGERLSPNSAGLDTYRSLPLALGHVVPASGKVTIRLRLQGYTAGAHHTHLYLNGAATPLGDWTWQGQLPYTATVTAQATLLSSSNELRVQALPSGATIDQWLVKWVDIDYSHTYAADDYGLFFKAPSAAGWLFAVTGLPSAKVQTWDVTDPANVKRIINAAMALQGSTYTARFRDTAAAQTRYLAASSTQWKAPANIVGRRLSTWRSPTRHADYIIITPPELRASAETLANHRRAKGLHVAVVLLEEVFDEFNYGIYNPGAVQDFLRYAYHSWVGSGPAPAPAPTYVLLMGAGTYDYRNDAHLSRANYIPPHIFETRSVGAAPSDNWFAEVNGTDILPDMLVGRLTAQTPAEAAEMVDKIVYYETYPPDGTWNRQALLVADDDDPEFERFSDELAGLLPRSYTAHTVYAAKYPPGSPTADISANVNAGRLLVSYTGHGGATTWGAWSAGSIFGIANVTDLANIRKPPVVTIVGCLNGFFVGPTLSESEAFLRRADRGAVAVLAPASLSYASEAKALIRAFYRAIYQDDLYAIGAATAAAQLAAYAEDSSRADLVRSYILLGDPALKLGLPANYPYVVSTVPADRTVTLRRDQPIHVQFSKRMDPSTVRLAVVEGAPGVTFTPSWNADNTAVDYSHAQLLPKYQRVTLAISGRDRLGNALGPGAAPSTWSFRVAVSAKYLPFVRR